MSCPVVCQERIAHTGADRRTVDHDDGAGTWAKAAFRRVDSIMTMRDAILLIAGCALLIAVGAAWARRRRGAGPALREHGANLARLRGRLRRLAADPRTPRRAQWILIGLAVYVVSPIDVIPDFIPVLGHADEIVLVPLALRWVRRMVPPEVWETHFPPQSGQEETVAPEAGP